jgi:hypothetical protein
MPHLWLYFACRRIEHGRNKSFDEVQFSNFRAEMSSKTISFHQPSETPLPSQSFSIPAATPNGPTKPPSVP